MCSPDILSADNLRKHMSDIRNFRIIISPVNKPYFN